MWIFIPVAQRMHKKHILEGGKNYLVKPGSDVRIIILTVLHDILKNYLVEDEVKILQIFDNDPRI